MSPLVLVPYTETVRQMVEFDHKPLQLHTHFLLYISHYHPKCHNSTIFSIEICRVPKLFHSNAHFFQFFPALREASCPKLMINVEPVHLSRHILNDELSVNQNHLTDILVNFHLKKKYKLNLRNYHLAQEH